MSLPAQSVAAAEFDLQEDTSKITHFISPENPPRILVVDDEADFLQIVKETLAVLGYETFGAASPVEALHLAEKHVFAMLLVDQRMPMMSGIELLNQIQQLQPDATRVLMTGVVDLSTILESINKGEIYRFLVKPWIQEELIVTVRNAVHRYELIRRNAKLFEATRSMNERLVQLNHHLEQKIVREEEQNTQLARLNQALQQNLSNSVDLCLTTVQAFYPGLAFQARQVHALCKAIVETLGLSPADRQVLEISSLLHDIGFLAVPRRMIKLWHKSPDLLNGAEKAAIEQHPLLGQELVSFSNHLCEVGTVIRAHHERFDGKGYPDKLSGEDIPWLARLLAAAEGYVAAEIRNADPAATLRSGSGTLYDPEAVRVVLVARQSATRPRREREVALAQLSAGMVLACGIYTSNGMLLSPAGQVLNEPAIEKLNNHHRVNPIRQSLLIYC